MPRHKNTSGARVKTTVHKGTGLASSDKEIKQAEISPAPTVLQRILSLSDIELLILRVASIIFLILALLKVLVEEILSWWR
jgi:hypothetical protein